MKNIALIGNPNSGKSSIFNLLTNENQYVGNWAGVTIEKKEGYLKNDKDIKLIDLPGIYSLLPNSPEEVIAINFFINNKPDLILNIVDSTNIERNLFLTLQILELGIPTIIVLNMFDLVEKYKIDINVEQIEKMLGCPVITTSIKDENSINKLNQQIELNNINNYDYNKIYSKQITNIINKIKNYDNNTHDDWVYIKLLAENSNIIKHLNLNSDTLQYSKNLIKNYEDKNDVKIYEQLITEKYNFIDNITSKTVKWNTEHKHTISDKIDLVLLNKWLAIPIFLFIISVIYYVSIQLVGSIGSNIVSNFVEYFKDILSQVFNFFNINNFIKSLFLDGIVNGFCIILTFIPQLTLLFTFLSFLEDCGYMSRIAFIMDKIFNTFGLSGKSFIPMVVGCGCSVPAIMSSRTIEDEKERKLTIILTPFIPCGAKIPVFAFFISIFFANYSWIGSSMYLIGLIIAVLVGILLKITTKNKSYYNSSFTLEIPSYKLPQPSVIIKNVWRKLKSFIITGGITICITSSLVWLLQSINWSLSLTTIDNSILASIGKFLSPIFIPLGFCSWQAVVALLSGVMAKENIILTLSILLLGNNANQDIIPAISGIFNPVSAYSFMLFVLLSSPCVATVTTIKKEIGSWKDTLYIILFQNIVAYVICALFYQGSRLLSVFNTGIVWLLLMFTVLIISLIFIYKKIKIKNSDDGVAVDCNRISCAGCIMKDMCKKIQK